MILDSRPKLLPVLGPGLFPAGVLLLYASASIVLSPVAYDKVSASLELASFAGAFVIGRAFDLRLFWIAFSLVLTAEVGIQCLQYLGFDPFDSAGVGAGSFGNPNFLANALAIGVAGALSQRLIWFVPGGLLGLWLCGSRTGFAAACAAIILTYARRSAFFFLTAVPLAVVGYCILDHDKDSLSLMIRLGIWQDTLNHLTFFGHGFGSFFDLYQTFPVHTIPGLILPNHAYNDFFEVLSDLGIGALALWVLLIIAADRADSGTRIILITFAILALAHFPLFTPLTGQILFLTVGAALKEKSNAVQTELSTLRRRQAYGSWVDSWRWG